MNKKLGLIITSIVTIAILVTVGGWLEGTNDGGNSSSESGSTPIIQTGVDVMPLTEFNTDPHFENITIEIEEYFGKHVIYKVTNNSNVCYKSLSAFVYFKCDPLAGFPPLKNGEEYYDQIFVECIPANSVTYHLDEAFHKDLGKDPHSYTEYYKFEFGVDPYRIEFIKESSKISDHLIQDASDNIVFNRDNYDESMKQLGTIENKSNHTIRFKGFVVFANGKVANISNFADSQARGSQYERLIPAVGETFTVVDSYTCPVDFDYSGEMTEDILKKECKASKFTEIDCNSIYVESNFETIRDYDLYITAWYER